MRHHKDKLLQTNKLPLVSICRFWTIVCLIFIYCLSSVTTASMSKSNHFPLSQSYSSCFISTSGRVHRPNPGFSSSACIQSQSSFMGHVMKRTTHPTNHAHRLQHRRGNMQMFLGSDGGILGVGAPEVVVTLLVGYFILGPSELYKITKEIGKFIQNFRTLGSEATKSFETAMEDQLQMQEIRKAQRELNSAFSFRRSINVDEDGEVFAEPKPSESEDKSKMMDELNVDSTAMKKKKKRRIKRKTSDTMDSSITLPGDSQTTIPDLDMASEFPMETLSAQISMEIDENGSQESIDVPSTRNDLLSSPSDIMTGSDGRLDRDHTIIDETNKQPLWFDEEEKQARFAAQMSGNWNQRILDNEETLSPLAQVMEKLALLEEEREMINQRLEEEFRLRKQNDESYYQKKRALLENAAQQISTSLYGKD